MEIFPVVELEDQRQIAGVVARAGFEESERGGVCTEASVYGQFKVIARIIRGRIGGKAAPGAVLDALIYGEE